MMVDWKKLWQTLLLPAIPAIIFVACKKDSDIPDPYCSASGEGTITLLLRPQHHGDPVSGQPGYPDSAFIKYNANEFPGDNPALYDQIVVGNSGSPEVAVQNLTCGQYFIYMTGFDTSINERVKGGIPIFVHNDDMLKVVVIPVTED